MLKNYVSGILLQNFGFEPTPGQQLLLDALANFITDPNEDQILLIKGYAGTGKTTAVNTLVKTLPQFKLKAELLAPTGRAAKVLAAYTDKRASTIHKKIYRLKSSKEDSERFVLDHNAHSHTIFVVDEASMIANSAMDTSVFGTGRLLDDLMMYVFNDRKCKLIIMGDTAQLPPVGLSISPALDKNMLEGYGKTVIEVMLTDVVRQGKESGILKNATALRAILDESANYVEQPKFDLDGFPDVERVNGTELIDLISSSYATYGMDDTMVVTRSNKRANKFNQGIRNTILFREEEISGGDLLMVVKNNYHWVGEGAQVDFIANGDIVELLRVKRTQEAYGLHFADVDIKLVDYDLELEVKVMLDTLHVEAPALGNEQAKALFWAVAEDYGHITQKRKRYQAVREDPFFNALQVKFAYAVTCHKAQGGQWASVFLDQGYYTQDMLTTDYLRWLYTACTRAREKIYLVNFNERFFPDA